MNTDSMMYYKMFAYKLKRSFPRLNIYLNIEGGIIRNFLEPHNLYIAKKENNFNAIFSYRRYQNISEIGHSEFDPMDHALLFHGWAGSHVKYDKNEINQSLSEYFEELHFSNSIYSKVNNERKIFDEDYNLLSDNDANDFGDDLIHVINKILLKNSLEIFTADEVLPKISDDEEHIWGVDLIKMVSFIGRYQFASNSKLKEDELIIKMKEIWGEDLIDLVAERARLFNYEVKDHFAAWKLETYLLGNVKIL